MTFAGMAILLDEYSFEARGGAGIFAAPAGLAIGASGVR
jgi:hypothetical protein